MAEDIIVGDRKAMVVEFRNEAGALTSPTTVTAECRSPSGVVTPLTATEETAGVWRATMPTFNEGGWWAVYVAGTAGLIAAHQMTIQVDPKATTP